MPRRRRPSCDDGGAVLITNSAAKDGGFLGASLYSGAKGAVRAIVRSLAFEERRELLESVLADVEPPVILAERVEGTIEQPLAQARQRGLEGLLAKREDSSYVGGRSRDWLKLKLQATQGVVITGFLPISNGRNEVGALLVAVQDRDGLRYAGRVGTGFNAAQRRDLLRILEARRIAAAPVLGAPRIREARWAKPELVAQVAFTEWTEDGKLRHPVFQGCVPTRGPRNALVRLSGFRAEGAQGFDTRLGSDGARRKSMFRLSFGRCLNKTPDCRILGGELPRADAKPV